MRIKMSEYLESTDPPNALRDAISDATRGVKMGVRVEWYDPDGSLRAVYSNGRWMSGGPNSVELSFIESVACIP